MKNEDLNKTRKELERMREESERFKREVERVEAQQEVKEQELGARLSKAEECIADWEKWHEN